MKQKHESGKRLPAGNKGERNSNIGKTLNTVQKYTGVLLDYLRNKRTYFVSDAGVAIDKMSAKRRIAKNLFYV
jgi:hypothetical protein